VAKDLSLYVRHGRLVPFQWLIHTTPGTAVISAPGLCTCAIFGFYTTSAAQKPVKPDLITRYNMQSQINSKEKKKVEEFPPTGWAPIKELRQQILQRRRG